MIITAAQFANMAHKGQTRRYTGRPYIEHPMRVAGRLCLIDGVRDDEVSAAWLHDVFEDCPQYKQRCLLLFPSQVTNLVWWLTKPEVEGSRQVRKRAMCDRMKDAPYWAKVIKYLDRIDNLRELPDCEFRDLYCRESVELAEAMVCKLTLPLYDELIKEAI